MTDTSQTSQADQLATISDLMRDARTAMLTTIEADGTMVARPMAAQAIDDDGDVWFFSSAGARKIDHVKARPAVNVTFGTGSSWVSLAGTAEVVRDRHKARALWNPVVEAWFPEGPDDDDIVLVRVHADSAEYWDSPGGRIATLVSFVKAKVTGERYDGGENERVEL